jgi:hypothetical protein
MLLSLKPTLQLALHNNLVTNIFKSITLHRPSLTSALFVVWSLWQSDRQVESSADLSWPDMLSEEETCSHYTWTHLLKLKFPTTTRLHITAWWPWILFFSASLHLRVHMLSDPVRWLEDWFTSNFLSVRWPNDIMLNWPSADHMQRERKWVVQFA